MTRNQAIKHARENVSTLYVFGNGYKYLTYDKELNVWRESHPREYHSAQTHRSQTLVDIARDAMGLKWKPYYGGSWTDYL